MIVIEIRSTLSRLVGNIDERVFKYLRENCSYPVADVDMIRKSARIRANSSQLRADHAKAAQLERWDGRKHLLTETTRTFPTGLLDRMIHLLTMLNVQFQVVDSRVSPNNLRANPLRNDALLRDYQQMAVEAALHLRAGTIRVPTGGGKTRIGAAIMAQLHRPSLFLVTRRDLLYQALDVFRSLFAGYETIGQVGDGIYEPGFITVATIQTICSAMGISVKKADEEEKDAEQLTMSRAAAPVIHEMIRNAEVVIFDEVQHVAAATCSDVLEAAEGALYRLGLSATDWRDDGEDMLIEAVIGPRIVNIQASELIAGGWLVPPRIRLYMMAQHDEKNVRCGGTFSAIYKTYYENNGAFHRQTTDINREWLAQGRKVLTLVTSVAHGEKLERMHHENGLPAVFLSGRDKADRRHSVLEDIRAGRLSHLIATSIADEGLDLPALDALNLAGGGKSSTRAYQRIGRVLRPAPGKTEGWVADYRCPDHHSLDSQYKRRVQIYEAEKAFVLDTRV